MIPTNPTIEQFDVTPQERRNVEDRAKLRAELRKEFVKQSTNPFRHGEGGYVFDPALQRWQSAKAQHWHYFKKTKHTMLAPLIVFATCFGYGHFLHVRRSKRELEYRQGLVSYADRQFKFI